MRSELKVNQNRCASDCILKPPPFYRLWEKCADSMVSCDHTFPNDTLLHRSEPDDGVWLPTAETRFHVVDRIVAGSLRRHYARLARGEIEATPCIVTPTRENQREAVGYNYEFGISIIGLDHMSR